MGRFGESSNSPMKMNIDFTTRFASVVLACLFLSNDLMATTRVLFNGYQFQEKESYEPTLMAPLVDLNSALDLEKIPSESAVLEGELLGPVEIHPTNNNEEVIDRSAVLDFEVLAASAEGANLKGVSIYAVSVAESYPIPGQYSNVTRGSYAWRLSSGAEEDNTAELVKNYSIAIGVDAAKIHSQSQMNQVQVFFWDKEQARWKVSKVTKVDMARLRVEAMVPSETDYFAGLIKTPDMPEAGAFVPTNISDVEPANPATGMRLIQPPSINRQGSANVSYPLWVPQGRQGMTPSLAVSYSSDGGYSWAGNGWNVSTSSISVDTKWGVPTYSSTIESEGYLVEGQAVLQEGGFRPNVASFDQSGNLISYPRQSDSSAFFPRVQNSYQRIVRVGNSPSDYFWKVIDASKTVRYYGSSDGERVNNSCVLRRGSSGPIAQWYLTRVEDQWGNYIEYEYDTHTIAPGDSNLMLLGGKNIYPSRITYTGHGTTPGKYSVEFVTQDNELDGRVSMNYGFKVVDNLLLDKVHVFYETDTLVTYDLRYFSDNPSFDNNQTHFKTVLKSIAEVRNGADFYEHTFEYYSGGITYRSNEEEIVVPQVYNYLSTAPWYASDLVNPLYSSKEPSPINTSITDGSGGHGGVGFGISEKFMGIKLDKSLGVNIGMSGSKNNTDGIRQMMDVNGDGIQDLIFREGDNIYYNSLVRNSDGSLQIGTKHMIHTDAVSSSFATSLGGKVEVAGPGEEPVQVGINYSRGTSESTRSLVDYNADGFPDLVYRESGIVKIAFGSISENGDLVFRSSSQDSHNPVLKGASVIPNSDDDDFKKPMEVVRVWKAFETGQIRITGTASLEAGSSGEVEIALQHNDSIVGGGFSAINSTTSKTFNQYLNVTKGDIIMFRVRSGEESNEDLLKWNPVVRYSSGLKTDGQGTNWGLSSSHAGYVLSSTNAVSFKGDRAFKVHPNFLNGATLSDDVNLIIDLYINGDHNATYSTTLSAGTMGTVGNFAPFLADNYSAQNFHSFPTLGNSDIVSLFFRVESSSNVQWNSLKWMPIVEMASDCGNPIEEYYPVPDYMTYNELDLYGGVKTLSRLDNEDNYQLIPNISVSSGDVGSIVTENSFPKGVTYMTIKSQGTTIQKMALVFDRATGQIQLKTVDMSVGNEWLDPSFIGGNSFNPNGFNLATGSYFSGNQASEGVYVEFFAKGPYAAGMISFLQSNLTGFGLYSEQLGAVSTEPASEVSYYLRETNELQMHYKHWGVFAWSPREGEENFAINPSDLHFPLQQLANQDPNDYDLASIENNPGNYNAEDFEFWVLQAVRGENERDLWEYQKQYVPTVREMDRYALPGHPLAAFRKQGGFSPMILGEMELEEGEPGIDESNNNPIYTAGGVLSRGRSHNLSINGGAGKVSGSVTISDPLVFFSRQKNQFIDLNGDGYPDILQDDSGIKAQFTTQLGGYNSQVTIDNLNRLGKGTQLGFDASVGGKYSTEDKRFKVGGSLGYNQSYSKSRTQLIDINGDGIPDSYEDGVTNNTFHLGNGYGFEDNPFTAIGFIRNQAFGASLGVFAPFSASWTKCINSWSAGLNVNVVGNYSDKFYFDFNGDGLQDYVDLFGANDLYLNTGVGFEKMSANYNLPINENINKSGSTGISAQASLTLGPILSFITFPISGGYSDNFSMNRVKTSFMDMNGDGAPDYVHAEDGNLKIYYAEFGEVNKLKTVNNPLGGSFTLNYEVVGNKRGYFEPEIKTHLSEENNEKILWDMSNSKWVLSSVVVNDGLDVNDGTNDLDGVDQYETKFAYDGGIRLRRERDFVGFTRIATISPNSEGVLEDYCKTSEHFNVENSRDVQHLYSHPYQPGNNGQAKTSVKALGRYNYSVKDYVQPINLSPEEYKKYLYTKDILLNTYELHLHSWRDSVDVFNVSDPEDPKFERTDKWEHVHVELISDKSIDYELRLVSTGIGSWSNSNNLGQVVDVDQSNDDWLLVDEIYPTLSLIPENITVFPASTDKRDINFPVVEDRTGINTQKYHIKYDEYFNVVWFEDFGEVIQPRIDTVPLDTIYYGHYVFQTQQNNCNSLDSNITDLGNNHYYVVVESDSIGSGYSNDTIYGVHSDSTSCGYFLGYGPLAHCDTAQEPAYFSSTHRKWVVDEIIIYELQDNSMYDRRIIATMGYFTPSTANGRTNALEVHKVYAQNTNPSNLRRFTEVSSLQDGKVADQITNHLSWSPDPAESAVSDLTYDAYGNVLNVTSPENHQGQRAITSYSYDTEVHQFVERVDNVYGEFVCNVYDYGYQQLLQNTGVNGHVMRYSYDANRRPEHIWAPREVNNPSNGPTISFDYDLTASIPVAYTYHNTGISAPNATFGSSTTLCGSLNDISSWNKSMASRVGTATFVDGMDRVAQVQTQTDWDDPTTTADHSMVTKTQVSGHTNYNIFGHVTSQRNDHLVNAADFGTFQTYASDEVAKTEYDYLGRPVESKSVYSTDDGSIAWSTTTQVREWADFDGVSRYMEETNLDGKSINRSYIDPKGRQVAVESEGDSWLGTQETTRFTFDDIGQMTETTNPAGMKTIYTYDFFGRVIEENHPDRGITSNTYDLLGNVTEIQTPGTSQDVSGGTITMRYNHGRLIRKLMPKASASDKSLYDVKYSYGVLGDGVNGAGRIVAVEQGDTTDPVLVESFEYDELGQNIKQSRNIDIPQAGVSSFVTSFKYDSFGRMIKIDYPDNEVLNYHYSSLGSLTRVSVSDGICTGLPDVIEELSYDGFGNRVYLKYGNGTETNYGYHPITRGLMSSNVLATPVGGYTDRNVMSRQYSYNTLGMVSNAKVTPHRSFMNSVSTLSTNFTYDGLLRLENATTNISAAQYDPGTDPEPGMIFNSYSGTMYSVDMGYGSAGRITSKNSSEGSATSLVDNSMDYDLSYEYKEPINAHLILSVTDNISGANSSFGYNNSGSITSIYTNLGGSTIDKIDMLWNEEQWMVADQNQNGVHHYVYDYSGERIMKSTYSATNLWQDGNSAGSSGDLDAYTVYVNPYLVLNSYEENEELLNKKTLHYYVGAERVASGEFSRYIQEGPSEEGNEGRSSEKTSMMDANSSTSAIEETRTSDNEALNSKTPNNPKSSNAVLDQLEEILTHFGYEEGKDYTRESLEKPVPLSTVYPEFSSTSSVNKQGGTAEIEIAGHPYAAANGSSTVEYCEGLITEVYWYHNNYLGSVDLVTNTSGEVHQFFLYNAWGENLYEYNPATPGFDSPYRFNGKELDKETGLAYYGARYYQNKFSIWLSVDRLAEKYPNSSPYVFSGNNPIMLMDPNGDSVNVAHIMTVDPTMWKSIKEDLEFIGGLKISESKGGNITFEIDESAEDFSQEARDKMVTAFGDKEKHVKAWVTYDESAASTDELGMCRSQIKGFIDNTSSDLDPRTLGFGMTFLHELGHTDLGGGLKDYNLHYDNGANVKSMNKIREQLGKARWGERYYFKQLDKSTGESYIPFSRGTFLDLRNGFTPQNKYIKGTLN